MTASRIEEPAIRLHYDEKADALYLRLDDSKTEESQEAQPGIVLDFNARKQVVAIEVLRLKDRFPSTDVKRLRFEVV